MSKINRQSMSEINRLQQLAGINEIKVNKPISKQEIFDAVYQFNDALIYPLVVNPSLNAFIEDTDYDDLTDLLDDNWGYEEPYLTEAKNLIETYYKIILPGDVSLVKDKTSVLGFKNVILIEPEDDDYYNAYCVLTKF